MGQRGLAHPRGAADQVDHRSSAYAVFQGVKRHCNSKMQVLKRIAFGLPNFEHFLLRVIAFCG